MALRPVTQAFRFALDPSPWQERALEAHVRVARYAYNLGMQWTIEALTRRQIEKDTTGKATTKLPDHFTLCRMWTVHKDTSAPCPACRRIVTWADGAWRTRDGGPCLDGPLHAHPMFQCRHCGRPLVRTGADQWQGVGGGCVPGKTHYPLPGLAWVSEASAGTAQAALRAVAAAWKAFFDARAGRRAGRVGRPRFKSRKATAASFQAHGGGLAVPDHRHVRLPKIGPIRSHEKTKKLLRLLKRPPVDCTACGGRGVTAVPATGRNTLPAGYLATAFRVAAGAATPAGFLAAALAAAVGACGARLAACDACNGAGKVPHTRLVRANVTRTASGRWYVALTVETHRDTRSRAVPGGPLGLGTPAYVPKPSRRQRAGGTVGVDFGIRDLVTLSTGHRVPNPRHYETAQRRLAAAQRVFARTQPGSGRREKARRRLARLHERVANLRKDFLSKLASELVHRHSVIAVEGWDVKVAARRADEQLPRRVQRARNRALLTSGIGELRWMITRRAEWYGARVVVTGAHEPTSRTCSACGQVRTKPVPPAEERFTCSACGYTADRRINTARLLARLARRAVDAPSGGESLNARGAGVRPTGPRAGGRPASKREARARPSGRGKAGTPDP